VRLDRDESDRFFFEGLREWDSSPGVIIVVVGNISGYDSTVTGLDSDITNDFSIWMGSISFLFFEFNFKGNVTDGISSCNDGMTTVVGLALGVYDWNIVKGFLKVNHNEIFHNITNSADLK